MTRGGAIPSGTLESPLSTSRVKALTQTSTLHQVTEKTGSEIAMFGCLYSLSSIVNTKGPPPPISIVQLRLW